MSKRVLVVEDDADVREGLIEVLKSENYLVDSAENGQIALNRLLSNEHLPDLILLDLMMPVMDGLTFLGKLKSDFRDRLGHLPVVITTASRNDSVRKTKEIAGFIGKPIDLDELFSTVSTCLVKQEI